MGLLNRREWEESAAAVIPSVWFTDCRSAHQALQRPVQKGVDKRLGIELAALRQSLWRYPGRTALEARLQDGPPAEPTDRCRWIDTLVEHADSICTSIVDAIDSLNRCEREEDAASIILSVLFTDCRSTRQALQRPLHEDKG